MEKLKEDSGKAQLPAKEFIQRSKEENPKIWNEIASFVTLLDEIGVKSYRLTASIEDPIVIGYSIT